MNMKEYYQMLRSIPKEDRDRIGFTDEYLIRAEAQETEIMELLENM